MSLLLMSGSLIPSARAKPHRPPARIAIQIEGPQATESRDAALGLLPETVAVVEEDDFRRALAVAGLPGGRLGHALTSPRYRPSLLRVVQRAVRKQQLGGALLGRMRGGRGGLQLVLVYVEAEGDPLIDTTVPQRGAYQERQKALEPIMQVVADVLRPPEPEPEPTPTEEEEVTPSDEDEGDGSHVAEQHEEEAYEYLPNRPGSELLSLGLGLGFGGRFFSFSEEVPRSANLRDYDVFGVPMLRLRGAIYPAATTGVVFVRDLGLTVEYAHAIGLSSATSDGRRRFATNWNRFWGGLRYRIPVGDEQAPFVIGLDGRAGFHRFTFSAEDDEAATISEQVAEVEYVLVRAGIDVRFPLGESVGLTAAIGYDAPIEGGATYERFRDHSLAGMDAGLSLAVLLGAGFELAFGVDYAGIFASLEADSTDAYVASGATDHGVVLSLGAAYRY